VSEKPALDRLFTSRLVLQPATPEQIRAIVSGDYARASTAIGADAPVGWPHESEAREGLPWHLAALERDADQLLWRIRFIIEAATNGVIGSINLKGLPSEDGDAEIGWGIVSEKRRCGFASEATQAVIDWAFQSSAVRRVMATVPENNEASQRVARRVGMIRTGELRRGLPVWAVAP